MARFLFAPIPATGHVNPGLPIAEELVRRGHDVRWYTTPRFKEAVERTGARYVPYTKAWKFDEQSASKDFPERDKLKGLAQLRFDMKKLFIDIVEGQLADLEEEYRREPFDIAIGDNTAGIVGLLNERFGVRWAIYGVSVYTMSSDDTAPFGLGIMPKSGALGRLRNRMLRKLVHKAVFRDVDKHYHATRARLGFKKADNFLFDFALGTDLYLQSSIEDFEYPMSDLPENVHFIGCFVPPPPANSTLPSWWSELDSGKRVVLITQGTVANDYDDLIRPAIRALAGEDVLVLVTTGSNPPSAIGMDVLPENVRVEQFVPYAHLMPKVDLLVTNGGFGSVQIALTNGVPLVCFGGSEDKPEIANRINWSGVGIGVRKKRATEAELLSAVRQVLAVPTFRNRARELQAEIARRDARKSAGDLLETLVPEAPKSQNPKAREATQKQLSGAAS